MLAAHWHGTIIELRSDREHDPDGSRLKAILAAYFDAEHACVFRQLLWQRLSIIAGIAMVIEAVTRFASAGIFATILAVLCGTGLVGSLIEWRAEREFIRLIKEVSDAKDG